MFKKALLPVYLLITALMIFLRWRFPDTPYEIAGPGAFISALYAIGLTLFVLFLSAGLGAILLNWLSKYPWNWIEKTILSLGLGMGTLAYLIQMMGLLGWLQPFQLVILLGCVLLVGYRELQNILSSFPVNLWKVFATWKSFSPIPKILVIVGGFTLTLTIFQTLTPPFDYDGLAYHLQGPKLYLEAGRILPIAENWFTFYPFTWEMLYMLGMGLGSDVFPRLLHFATLILLLLATYSAGKSLLPRPAGWMAAAILIGIPIMPLWGSIAYTDLAWALYQFLAVLLILYWVREKQTKLLVLAAVMQGFALGNKYLALGGLGACGLLVLYYGWKDARWQGALKAGAIFGGIALLVASPWYVRNLIWTGNPVYPLLFSSNGIDPVRIRLWTEYIQSFGVGRQWYNYLLLPIDLFINHTRFGTFIGGMDIPSPIFLLVLVYPLTRRLHKEDLTRWTDPLAVAGFIQYVIWALGSQQTRFLLPIFPILALLAADILLLINERIKWHQLGKALSVAAISGCLLVTAFIISISFLQLNPTNLLVGRVTRAQFLSRMLNDYKSLTYVSEVLPTTSRVLMLWDGRGYYCDEKCIADVDQTHWLAIAVNGDPFSINQFMTTNKITHILFSKEDADFFLLGHDPYKKHAASWKMLTDSYLPACSVEIFQNRGLQLFKLQLQNETCK